jgi:phosphopantothenoylcysteine decarboxylase/phosphopantothenate--cysteine ligase
MLKGKKVVLGVTGGIAAYKAAEFVRLLVKEEVDVHVVMTENAQKFIAPLTFQTLSGNSVAAILCLLENAQISICVGGSGGVVAILPATANIIGKIANGLRMIFSTLVMATQAPILIVPSLNVNLWENAALQKNLQTLHE